MIVYFKLFFICFCVLFIQCSDHSVLISVSKDAEIDIDDSSFDNSSENNFNDALNDPINDTIQDSTIDSNDIGDGNVIIKDWPIILGVISWDAWAPESVSRGWVGSTLFTTYKDRQTCLPVVGCYWYTINNVFADGNTFTGQERMDAEINILADHAITFRSFVWYPAPELISGAIPLSSDISQAFKNYKSSKFKNRLKFNFIVQKNWSDHVDYPKFVSWWVEQFSDPQYLKIGNRPVFTLMQRTTSADANWTIAQLQKLTDATISAGFDAPYYVSISIGTLHSQNLGVAARTSYGPRNRPVGTGEMPWASQVLEDVGAWTSLGNGGFKVMLPLTPCADGRPRGHNWWVIRPTFDEWKAHLRRARTWMKNNPTKHDKMALIYAMNEIDEGGDFLPTVVNGEKYLDGVLEVLSE